MTINKEEELKKGLGILKEAIDNPDEYFKTMKKHEQKKNTLSENKERIPASYSRLK